MEMIDLILLIPLIYGAWKGFKKGFIMELFTIFALLIGLYAAFHFSDKITELILGKTHEQTSYLPAISFLLLFLGVGAMVYFGGKALEQVLKIAQLSFINKAIGALLGTIKWSYIIGCILLFFFSLDKQEKIFSKKVKDESLLIPILKGLVSNSIPGVTNTYLFNYSDSTVTSRETNLTVEQVIEAKEIADSLGIEVKDAKTIIEINKKYGN